MSQHQKRTIPVEQTDACRRVRGILEEVLNQTDFYEALCESVRLCRPVRYETKIGTNRQSILIQVGSWISALAVLRMFGTDVSGDDEQEREQSLQNRNSFVRGLRVHDTDKTLCVVRLEAMSVWCYVKFTQTSGGKPLLTIGVKPIS
jgi:hypothetical protein